MRSVPAARNSASRLKGRSHRSPAGRRAMARDKPDAKKPPRPWTPAELAAIERETARLERAFNRKYPARKPRWTPAEFEALERKTMSDFAFMKKWLTEMLPVID